MATHRLSKTPVHLIWSAMKARCNNPNNKNYDRYGGRGIKVCERWSESFEAFAADMGPRPSSSHSLDRIDNDGPYEPSNCRWASKEEQVYNRCTNKPVLYCGKEMRLIDAVNAAGSLVRLSLARGRIIAGWTVEEAVETPNLFATGKVIRQEQTHGL